MDTSPRLLDNEVDGIVQYRGNQWQDAINQELQYLITEASELRAEINNAKTGTKKRYYEKKFKKIQQQVMQALVAKQRIDAKLGVDEYSELADLADEPQTEGTELSHEVHSGLNPITIS